MLADLAWWLVRHSPAGGGRAGGALGVWLLWDAYLRWRWKLRPVREGGLLLVVRVRHRGREVALADGTVVRARDPILSMHFDNAAVLARAREHPWAILRAMEEDGRALARSPELIGDAVALHGITLFAAAARRFGCEVRPLPRTTYAGLLRLFLVGFLAIHHPDGWRGIRKPEALWPGEAWMSIAKLRSAHPPSA